MTSAKGDAGKAKGKGEENKGKGKSKALHGCAAQIEGQMSLDELADDDNYDQDVPPEDVLAAWSAQGSCMGTPAEWLMPEARRQPTGFMADGSWMECRNGEYCTNMQCVFRHPGQSDAINQPGSLSGLLLGMAGRNFWKKVGFL